MTLNCNRRHHRDHNRPEHSSPWEHNRLSNSPSAEHKERTRRYNSRHNQLPTIRQKATDSKRWLSRMRLQKHQSSTLSQSIASFGIRLAAVHRRKKRLLPNAATIEATLDRDLPRSPGLHVHRAGKNFPDRHPDQGHRIYTCHRIYYRLNKSYMFCRPPVLQWRRDVCQTALSETDPASHASVVSHSDGIL